MERILRNNHFFSLHLTNKPKSINQIIHLGQSFDKFLTSVSGILAVLTIKSDYGTTMAAPRRPHRKKRAEEGHIMGSAMLRVGTHQGKRQAAGRAKL